MTRTAASSPTEAPPEANQKSARREMSQGSSLGNKLVSSDVTFSQYPKFEYRNPKQIRYVKPDT
jgi:hypothetical protein